MVESLGKRAREPARSPARTARSKLMWGEVGEVGKDTLCRVLCRIKNFNIYLKNNENHLRVLSRRLTWSNVCFQKITVAAEERVGGGGVFVDARSPVNRLL